MASSEKTSNTCSTRNRFSKLGSMLKQTSPFKKNTHLIGIPVSKGRPEKPHMRCWSLVVTAMPPNHDDENPSSICQLWASIELQTGVKWKTQSAPTYILSSEFVGSTKAMHTNYLSRFVQQSFLRELDDLVLPPVQDSSISSRQYL